MNENIITGVSEKLVGVGTWIKLNFLNDPWDQISVPGTEVHMALIGHAFNATGGFWTSTNSLVHDNGSIDLWEDDAAVVTTNEINDPHKVELPLDGSGLSLNGSINNGPWNWDSSWASKVEWKVPDVIELLGIDTSVDDGISELFWDHLPVEDRNKFFKILWVVHELSEARYKTVRHGIIIVDNDIGEGGGALGTTDFNGVVVSCQHNLCNKKMKNMIRD